MRKYTINEFDHSFGHFVAVEIYKASEADAEIASLRSEVAALKGELELREAALAAQRAVLRWALKHGAKDALDGTLRDSGCGCCSHHLEIPTEYAPLIAEAMKP